jgi:short-subunit dehydrogenase
MSEQRSRVLVTGGSSGIGFELARKFVDHDHDVVIAAYDIEKLEQAAELLREQGQADVRTVAADLATEEGIYALHRELRNIGPIDIFCANAGVGSGGGDFSETDLDQELELIDLNVRGQVQLTKLIVRDMIEAGQGGRILLTSSIAGIMPGPFEAVYAASKAFVRSFGEGLRSELSEKGISVTVLMPGPTETDFFHRANMDNTPAGQMAKDDPALVASQAFDALMADRHAVIGGGLKNKLQTSAIRLFPDPLKARAHRAQTEPLDRTSEHSGPSGAAVAGFMLVGAIAAAGTAAWLQSRRDEDEVDRRTRDRLEPHADFDVAGRTVT